MCSLPWECEEEADEAHAETEDGIGVRQAEGCVHCSVRKIKVSGHIGARFRNSRCVGVAAGAGECREKVIVKLGKWLRLDRPRPPVEAAGRLKSTVGLGTSLEGRLWGGGAGVTRRELEQGVYLPSELEQEVAQ